MVFSLLSHTLTLSAQFILVILFLLSLEPLPCLRIVYHLVAAACSSLFMSLAIRMFIKTTGDFISMSATSRWRCCMNSLGDATDDGDEPEQI